MENQPSGRPARRHNPRRGNVNHPGNPGPEAGNNENQENQDPQGHQARNANPPQADFRYDHLFVEHYGQDPIRLVPRDTRLYGYRPRGVVLRFRDPPLWTRGRLGKEILMEMNFQEYFNRKIDQAYDVTRFARFKNYSNVISTVQLSFIFLLATYLTCMYAILHENLTSYYFIVTND